MTDNNVNTTTETPGQKNESGAGNKECEQDFTPLPPLTFGTFILSLSTSVLINLGCTPDPITGQCQKEFAAARQTIDLIELLQTKTRGNLTQEEEGLLRSILFDLRLKYIEVINEGNK